MNPNISIIIPHYNNYTILKECIDSLTKINFNDYEIIIVDNNSSDNSAQRIKKEFSQIILHQLNKNIGYAGACNKGANISNGEYLLFINNDTTHDLNFLKILFEKIKSNNKIAAVQPKVKSIKNTEYFDYAGASGGYIDYLVFPFTRGRIFHTIEKDNMQYDDSKKIFWASGVCFITKKELFMQLKGFDQSLFSHMEEIDYCWKCNLAGYECWVEPKSIVYHHGGKTLQYHSAQKTYLNHRNSMILLLTNYQLSLSLFLFPIRIILEIVSSFYDLLRFKILHFFAHYRAILYLLFNINHLNKRRQLIAKIRKLPDKFLFESNIILNESIVKKYFIFGKNKFNQVI